MLLLDANENDVLGIKFVKKHLRFVVTQARCLIQPCIVFNLRCLVVHDFEGIFLSCFSFKKRRYYLLVDIKNFHQNLWHFKKCFHASMQNVNLFLDLQSFTSKPGGMPGAVSVLIGISACYLTYLYACRLLRAIFL